MARPRVPATWSELPDEILERFLSPLSPRELGRCRVVCKRFSTVIGETARTFYNIGKKNCRKEFFALIAPNDFKTNSAISEYWVLTDPKSDEQHTLRCDFLDRLGGMEHFREQRTVAAAGSLICVLYTASSQGSTSVMVVCNPAAQTARKLPPLDLHGIYGKVNPGVVMVVNDAARSYKVFVIADCNANSRMLVYDSSVGQWESRCNPPASCISSSSASFHNGRVYTLFSLGREMGHQLAAYNIQEDKWDELRVRIPANLKIPQLVIAQGRLYMVAGRDTRAQGLRRLEIHRVTDTACKVVAKMPEKKLIKMWDGYDRDLKRTSWSPVDDGIGNNAKIVAVGHGNLILVMTSPEEVRYCDLEFQQYIWGKIEWGYEWEAPRRNLEIWTKLSHDSQRGWYGGQMRLGLSSLL